ncbi:MAG: discoidin domain-containing protein [Kiritimatiellia bacterium]|jgi:hypothetical protein|nr:discoidin domain-containing protein [Kiritimatiellia bacterium]
MLMRRVLLGVSICLMMGVAAVESAEDADRTLDRLAKALKAAEQPSEKKALLADVAKIKTPRALTIAAAAAADKEVAEDAVAAAGLIAQALTAGGQPPYIRRSAFLRWLRCQPQAQAIKTAVDALRNEDVVLQTCAMSFLGTDSAFINTVIKELDSFPAPVQARLMEIIVDRGDAAQLVEMSRHKDKKVAIAAVTALGKLGGNAALAGIGQALTASDQDVRAVALRALAGWPDASSLPLLLDIARQSGSEQEKTIALSGISKVAATAKLDQGARSNLLAALNLLMERSTEEAALAAIQLTKVLASSHPKEARQALDKLATRKLSPDVQERIQSILIAATINQLPNLARDAKASSPDGFDSQGPNPDAHAIDGKEATYWDETDNHKLYRLRVDFKQATQVAAISLMGWGHRSYSPKDFEIVCDDKTVKTVKNAVYTNNRLIVCFPRTSCSSLELKITGYYGGSPGIRELAIFNTP